MKIRCSLVLAVTAGCLIVPTAFAQVGSPASRPGAAEPAAGRSVDLRPKFRKGQEIRVNAQMSSREIVSAAKATPAGRTPSQPSTRPVTPSRSPGATRPATPSTTPGTTTPPAPEPSAFSQEMGLLLRVTSADPEKGATADLVFESFKLKGTTAVGDVDFDSTKKSTTPDDPIAEALRGVVGTTLEVVFDRDGNITSAQAKRSANPAGDDLSGMLAGAFTGGDLIKSLVGPITSGKPGSPTVRVGEKWTEQSRMGAGGGEWTIDVTKTLSSVRGNVAMIEMRGDVRLDNASPGGPSLGVSAQAPYTGTCEWDLERGFLKRLDSTLRVKSAAPTADIPEQTHESRVTITRVGG